MKMDKQTLLKGEIRDSTKWGKFKVLDFHGRWAAIEFVETGYSCVCSRHHALTGIVRDRYQPSVYDVGIQGEVRYVNDFRYEFDYNLWVNMLTRCYSETYQKRKPCYIGCTVSDEFQHFEKFRDWLRLQKGYSNTGFVLDKDILGNGGKYYSAETCCFVPQEINNVMVGLFSNKDGRLPVGVRKAKSGRYTAKLVNKSLGTFDSSEDAHRAYLVAKCDKVKSVAIEYREYLDDVVFEKLMSYGDLYV